MAELATSTRQVVVAGAPTGTDADALTPAVCSQLKRVPFGSAQTVTLAAASAVVARDPHGPAQRLGRLLASHGQEVRIIAPSRFLRGEGSRTVALATRIGRLKSVQAPRSLVDAEALILVNRLPAPNDLSSPVIGVWSRFVPLLLRLGALASGPREGLTAEIALAFQPALIVMTGAERGIDIVVATADQVAAELFGVACATTLRDDHDPETAVGPWEYPLVQRATELGLGVSLPSEIAMQRKWFGGEGPERSVFDGLVTEIATALGIPAPLVTDVN